MVPVKEAIESGAWLHFEGKDYHDEILQFRLRVLSFEKIDLTEVDEPHKVKMDEGGDYWLMRIEVVNLSKKPMNTQYIRETILLVDQEGFQFDVTMDVHLCWSSAYGENSGLGRFFGESLKPKTKVVGAISFFVPDDDEAEYSLAMRDGTVREA